MKPSYEQGKEGDIPLLALTAIGFSFFWMQFFAILLYDTVTRTLLAPAAITPPTPAATCLGLAAMSMLVSLRCDFFSSNKGTAALWASIILGPLVATAILCLQLFADITTPLPISLVAWFLQGMGLGASLALWSEMLSGFTKEFSSKATALAAGIGGVLYFVLCNFDFLLSIVAVYVSAFASLALLRLLEKEAPTTEFRSRAECVARHKLTKPVDALNTFYSIVFGLAIFLLNREASDAWLHAGIAAAIVVSALVMLPVFKRNTNRMMHGKAQRIVFPFLVAGLVLPFLDVSLKIPSMLVILVGYMILTLINLDSLYCLVKRFDVTAFYLVGRGVSPILVGLAIGYLLAFGLTGMGTGGDTTLSMAALVIIVVLSICIAVIDFDPDLLADERQQQDAPEEQPPVESAPGKLPWRRKCALIAEEHGLSTREVDVFLLLAKGRGTTYIQDKLYISSHTVKSHTYHIYKKLGVKSREELLTMVEEFEGEE